MSACTPWLQVLPIGLGKDSVRERRIHFRVRVRMSRAQFPGPKGLYRGASAALTLVCLAFPHALEAQQALNLPPIPVDQSPTQDYAGILDAEVRREIGRAQQEAIDRHGTPIVVVTIPRKAQYGGGDHSIEDFAREWFAHWGITGRGPGGEDRNHGILLLVSVQDRVARIELGGDWGRRWDAYAQEIMDRVIIPEFRRGDYGAGIREGTWALLSMAEMGPTATPPDAWGRSVRSVTDRVTGHTPLSAPLIGVMILGGLALIALSFVFPEYRKILLGVGIALIAGALVFWVLLVLLALMFQGRGSSGRGGFGGAGGFGGGGFSVGGGATGRW